MSATYPLPQNEMLMNTMYLLRPVEEFTISPTDTEVLDTLWGWSRLGWSVGMEDRKACADCDTCAAATEACPLWAFAIPVPQGDTA